MVQSTEEEGEEVNPQLSSLERMTLTAARNAKCYDDCAPDVGWGPMGTVPETILDRVLAQATLTRGDVRWTVLVRVLRAEWTA